MVSECQKSEFPDVTFIMPILWQINQRQDILPNHTLVPVTINVDATILDAEGVAMGPAAKVLAGVETLVSVLVYSRRGSLYGESDRTVICGNGASCHPYMYNL